MKLNKGECKLVKSINKYYYYYLWSIREWFVSVEWYIFKIQMSSWDSILNSERHLAKCCRIWQHEVLDEKLECIGSCSRPTVVELCLCQFNARNVAKVQLQESRLSASLECNYPGKLNYRILQLEIRMISLAAGWGLAVFDCLCCHAQTCNSFNVTYKVLTWGYKIFSKCKQTLTGRIQKSVFD